LISLLGRDAIGYASTAFNDGDIVACNKLSALALEICPGAKKSAPWIKLLCKRRIGLDRWRALQPFVVGWRQHVASMKARTN